MDVSCKLILHGYAHYEGMSNMVSNDHVYTRRPLGATFVIRNHLGQLPLLRKNQVCMSHPLDVVVIILRNIAPSCFLPISVLISFDSCL